MWHGVHLCLIPGVMIIFFHSVTFACSVKVMKFEDLAS
jgi:hypothetical protein